MRKNLNMETRKELLKDMMASGTSVPDDLIQVWGNNGGFISIETLSRITQLTPYKLRLLIKQGELPFAKYVASQKGDKGHGTFLISWTGFKNWIGLDDTTDDSNNETLKQIVQNQNKEPKEVKATATQTYNIGDVEKYYKTLVAKAKEKGTTPFEFKLILNAFDQNDPDALIDEVISFTSKVVIKYLQMYGVRLFVPTPEV